LHYRSIIKNTTAKSILKQAAKAKSSDTEALGAKFRLFQDGAKAWEGSQKQVSSGSNTPHLPGAPLQELTVLNLTSSDATRVKGQLKLRGGGGG
jgi:hypothetical protein